MKDSQKIHRLKIKQAKLTKLRKLEDKKNKKSRNIKIRNKASSIKLQDDQRKLRNASELRFREILLILNERFVWQQPFSDESRYVCVDFYLPNHNIVFEIDGYYHSKMLDYDVQRTRYLKKTHSIKKIIRINVKDLAIKFDDVSSYVASVLNKPTKNM